MVASQKVVTLPRQGQLCFTTRPMTSPEPFPPFEMPPSLPEELAVFVRTLLTHAAQVEAENVQFKEQFLQQAETIRELRDEIAVLKGQKGRPVIKPSRMDENTDGKGGQDNPPTSTFMRNAR